MNDSNEKTKTKTKTKTRTKKLKSSSNAAITNSIVEDVGSSQSSKTMESSENSPKPKTKTMKKKKGLCDGLSYEECEMAIFKKKHRKFELREANKYFSAKNIPKMVAIIDKFISVKKIILIGGSALNMLLPKKNKIYNKDITVPDYDTYSDDALNDAKTLGDVFVRSGYNNVIVTSGFSHAGTYLIYVNDIKIMDITHLPKTLYESLKQRSIVVDNIIVADPVFLRMNMHLELSRPSGDVRRFEKVMSRLVLLNKYYPLSKMKIVKECVHSKIDYQRHLHNEKLKPYESNIFNVILKTLLQEDIVFFGGFALAIYRKYMPLDNENDKKYVIKKIPDFDILSEDAEKIASHIKTKILDSNELSELHLKSDDVKIIQHDEFWDILPKHYEIKIYGDSVAFIYTPIACHNYNTLLYDKHKIKVATIDTMMAFYLGFSFIDKPYFDRTRLLCLANFLYDVQVKNNFKQVGPLKRFVMTCYGYQHGPEDFKRKRVEQYKKLMYNKKSKEYQKWFLYYNPNVNPDNHKEPNKIESNNLDAITHYKHKKSYRDSEDSPAPPNRWAFQNWFKWYGGQ